FAIAFFAPIVAGVLMTLRGRYLWGVVITAFFLAMEIRANHIQMTYYLFLALLILAGIELYHAYKNKTLQVYAKSIRYLTGAVILAVGVNASMLWVAYEYGHETIRRKSNLSQDASAGKPASGVDREYAYTWSQGVGENLTFLIPNAYGGESGHRLDKD